MVQTYYDSTLTDVQIQQVLDAINNILTPSNNGKVLAISSGTLEARSVQWGGGYPEPTGTITLTENGLHNVKDYSEANVQVQGGGSAVVQPLSVTQNGTYNPPSGVDGYAPVTVNVSGGGLDGVYTPVINPRYATLVYGNIVVHGHHAEMILRLSFSIKSTGIIGSVPASVRPAGVAYFRLGNGGNTSVGYGRVTPTGDIYITSSGLGGNYAHTYAEWDIPEQSYELTIPDTSLVQSVLGGIARIGNICTLCARITIQSNSSGWKQNVIVIPETIRPDGIITGCFYYDPYDVRSMSPPVKDATYNEETGGFDIWLPSGSNIGTFRTAWQIASA